MRVWEGLGKRGQKSSKKGKKFLSFFTIFFEFAIDFYIVRVYNKLVVVKSGVLWVKSVEKG